MSDNMRKVNIYNVTLTNGTTQYSQALPANVRAFAMQPRTAVDVFWSHESGAVAGADGTSAAVAPWMTMKAGAGFSVDDIAPESPLTVYLASLTSGTVVEIVAWSW